MAKRRYSSPIALARSIRDRVRAVVALESESRSFASVDEHHRFISMRPAQLRVRDLAGATATTTRVVTVASPSDDSPAGDPPAGDPPAGGGDSGNDDTTPYVPPVAQVKLAAATLLGKLLGTKPGKTKIAPVAKFSFGGSVAAFQPAGHKQLLKVTGTTAPLLVIGGCATSCQFKATFTADLGPAKKPAKGTRKAKRTLVKLKAQTLKLKAGASGVIKVTMSKKQAAQIAKVSKPKLTVVMVKTAADGTTVNSTS